MNRFAKFFAVTVASLALAASALAGVPAKAPTVPSPDELKAVWQADRQGTCTLKVGLEISQHNYFQPMEGTPLFNYLSLNRKNGEIVSVLSAVIIPGQGLVEGSIVVRGENKDEWTSYDLADESEGEKASEQIFARYGVSREFVVEKCQGQKQE